VTFLTFGIFVHGYVNFTLARGTESGKACGNATRRPFTTAVVVVIIIIIVIITDDSVAGGTIGGRHEL
jgi:hypothetical protein